MNTPISVSNNVAANLNDMLLNQSQVGVCVKNLDKTVTYQNQLCMNVCGNKTNSKCLEGCMSNFYSTSQEGFNDLGIQTKNYMEQGGQILDASIINNGKNLITFFVPITEKIQNKIQHYQRLGLTKAEMGVMSLKVRGLHNKEIAKKLFISLATLKTHINNIYKKVSKHTYKENT